jgi:hypothetical protein
MCDAYNTSVRKNEGEGPFGRPKGRWEDNINLDLTQLVYKGVDWIRLAQDRSQWRVLLNTVITVWVS